MVDEVASRDAPGPEFAGGKRRREVHGVMLPRAGGEDRAGTASRESPGAYGQAGSGGRWRRQPRIGYLLGLGTMPSAPSYVR